MYPIPRIDECLDSMIGSRVFTKMDLRSGFHQIQVVPEHRERTAFQTRYGSFQFRVMPFGLCNAPATFQRTMNLLLQEFAFFCTIYIDDIVVHSATEADHERHLALVLNKLRAEKFFAKRSKCLFAMPRIDFCGFVVSAAGIEKQPKKIEAITNWPTPKCVKYIRAFLGICGFCQRFIKNFAHTAAPMTELLKSTVPWT